MELIAAFGIVLVVTAVIFELGTRLSSMLRHKSRSHSHFNTLSHGKGNGYRHAA